MVLQSPSQPSAVDTAFEAALNRVFRWKRIVTRVRQHAGQTAQCLLSWLVVRPWLRTLPYVESVVQPPVPPETMSLEAIMDAYNTKTGELLDEESMQDLIFLTEETRLKQSFWKLFQGPSILAHLEDSDGFTVVKEESEDRPRPTSQPASMGPQRATNQSPSMVSSSTQPTAKHPIPSQSLSGEIKNHRDTDAAYRAFLREQARDRAHWTASLNARPKASGMRGFAPVSAPHEPAEVQPPAARNSKAVEAAIAAAQAATDASPETTEVTTPEHVVITQTTFIVGKQKCSCCGQIGRKVNGCSCRGGKSHPCLKFRKDPPGY